MSSGRRPGQSSSPSRCGPGVDRRIGGWPLTRLGCSCRTRPGSSTLSAARTPAPRPPRSSRQVRGPAQRDRGRRCRHMAPPASRDSAAGGDKAAAPGLADDLRRGALQLHRLRAAARDRVTFGARPRTHCSGRSVRPARLRRHVRRAGDRAGRTDHGRFLPPLRQQGGAALRGLRRSDHRPARADGRDFARGSWRRPTPFGR